MQNMLVVNAEGPEIRVAVVEDGALAEFFVERKRDRGIVGNIYRGKVTRQRLTADCHEDLVEARKVKAGSRTAVPASGQRRGKQKGVVPNSPEAPQL